MENGIKTVKKFYAELTGLFVFIVYLFTIAPSVIQIDTGELAAVQATLGIAHPTGYPLFTILGYLFLLIPLPFTKIFVANLLAAIFCSLTIVILVKTLYLILNRPVDSKEPKIEKQENIPIKKHLLNENRKIIFSIVGGLTLAFSETFWFQSTSVEVYSLHIFLISLIIYFILKFYLEGKNNLINWIIISLLLALGFSNHMTTLLILPSTAYLFFSQNKLNANGLKKIGLMILTGTAVLILFYSYLPLRAMQNPALNWGNPVNFENMIRHISGKQYQVWIFSSFDAAGKQLEYFLTGLPSEFGYLGLIAAIIGLFYAYKYYRKFFYFFITAFVFTLFYSINYDIVDIDSYFLLSYYSLTVFAALGVIYLYHKFKTDKSMLTIGFFVVPLLSLVVNFTKVDQSNVYTFEDYTKTILNSTKKNSLIFGYQWDYYISPSYYFQFVEGYRYDVKIIDKELLRRSWYFHQLENNYQNVIDDSKKEISKFLKVLEPFEKDEPYDGMLIEKHYRTMMTSLVKENLDERDIYITHELFANEMQRGEFLLPKGYTLVPHLLSYKVVHNEIQYVEAPLPEFEIRFPARQNKYTEFIYNMCGTMLLHRSLYERQTGHIDRSKIYYKKLIEDFPNYSIPQNIKTEMERLIDN